MIQIKKYESDFETRIKTFKDIINKSNNIVFFGGAGVSTDSGIKDFRGDDGVYNSKRYKSSPEDMLSDTFFYHNPKDFYEFYKNEFNTLDIEPNITHYKLQELELSGKLKGIITQNIDGLHEMTGSKNVLNLHGTIHKNFCTKCSKHKNNKIFYTAEKIFNSKEVIPRCPICGSILRPDIVLYGENLNMDLLKKAQELLFYADTLIIAGTSLEVHPVCDLIYSFHGENTIMINKTQTSYDEYCNLIFRENCKSVFESLS